MSFAASRVERETAEELRHELEPHFSELRRFNSTRALKRSPLYQRLEPEVERVLGSLVYEQWAPAPSPTGPPFLRATAWNIERGIQLPGILRALARHPRMRGSDVLLLTELDYGMARSGNRFIARDLARSLKLNFAFAPCYLSLVKGSGLERGVQGRNSLALHGNALFSPHPLREPHSLPLPNGKDKMKGQEKRLGCQKAVIAVVEHPRYPFRAVSLHLDAHSTQRHRHYQMQIVLDHLENFHPELPVLIGGDWNTSTYNSKNSFYSILGYCRRVAMGVRHVIQNHYPHPDRWFERHLFRGLERRGYRYRELNEPGACTLHYQVDDLALNENMGEWIPQWCFWFIQWALQRNAGRCSMKLDWFAGKGIEPWPDSPPKVLQEVHSRENRLSDHDPIVLDFRLSGNLS